MCRLSMSFSWSFINLSMMVDGCWFLLCQFIRVPPMGKRTSLPHLNLYHQFPPLHPSYILLDVRKCAPTLLLLLLLFLDIFSSFIFFLLVICVKMCVDRSGVWKDIIIPIHDIIGGIRE